MYLPSHSFKQGHEAGAGLGGPVHGTYAMEKSWRGYT